MPVPDKGYMQKDFWHFKTPEGKYARVDIKKAKTALKLKDDEKICWGYLTYPPRVPLEHWALICGGEHAASKDKVHADTLMKKRSFREALASDPSLMDTQSTPFR